MKLGLLDADYLAVCDADEERARAFASAARVERFTTDPSEIIRSPEINVVYITVTTAAHKRLVIEAAGAGKHIFCEKPLATNLADVEEMVEAVDAAGVKAGVGLILRHSPILTVLKSLTEDPTLGRLMVIVFRDDQFFPIQGHYMSDWRKDRSVAGSGTLLEHSIHDADVLHWFGGRVERVRGSLSNFAGYEGVEDLATVHLEFESGAFAELVSVWHGVLGRPSTRRLELFYEKGVFFIDHDFLGAIQVQTHARNAELIKEEEVRSRYLAQLGLNNEAFDQALRYSLEDYFFLRSVIDNSEPFPDFHVALQAHRLIDAVYRSAAGKNGEPVSMRGDM
ncbi:MAG: Gfo/Idh/MocA family oxidoreductase [Chloroflexi bacterium]|nr:MAG: Gfo/Idh/MocA family oxidoreductase [Chloroflexota bacterium]